MKLSVELNLRAKPKFEISLHYNLIVASKSSTRIHKCLKNLSENFNIKDMSKLQYFLGVKVVYTESEKIWIGQPTYIVDVF